MAAGRQGLEPPDAGAEAGLSPAAGPTGMRMSDRAEAAIEELIRVRRLRPGQRVPSERALSETLGISRPILREAIGRLAARGRLVVRPRGISVAEPSVADWVQETIVGPLAALAAGDPGYGRDVMEIRHALDGMAAWHAARRADAGDRARIRDRFDSMIRCHEAGNAEAEALGDAAFHLAIAEASHNAVLRQVMASLFGLLQRSISASHEKLYTVPRTFERLSEQHRALMEAILAGDAEGARAASDTHLRFVETTIRDIDEDRARQARSAAVRAADRPSAE